jgi:hypothetical protein
MELTLVLNYLVMPFISKFVLKYTLFLEPSYVSGIYFIC